MDGEALRHLEQPLVQLEERLGGYGGVDLRVGAAADPALLAPRARRPERRLQLLVNGAQACLLGFDEPLGLRRPDQVELGEPGSVLLAHGRVLLDQLVHERLRVARLVALVVPEAAVADEVDDDVVVELLPEGHRQANGRDGRLWVVGVHVEDRRVEALGEVGGVPRRAALVRIGREPDLVVRDQVQRAARGVAGETSEVERLGDDSLAGESGIPVDEDGERQVGIVRPFRRVVVGLRRAHLALDDRVDVLQMARVRGERDRHVAAPRRPRGLGAEVVLDVARAGLEVGGDRLEHPLALELAQDRVRLAPDRVREDVQSPAVRHAHDDVVRAVGGRQLDRLVEHRHHHVETLDGELLLAEEGAAEVALEPLDLGEPGQERLLLLHRQRLAVAAGLDGRAQPQPLLVARDVLDLVGQRPAVGLPQLGKCLGQRFGRHVEAQELGGDPRLELGRQPRLEPVRVERRVAGWLGRRAGRCGRRGGRASGAPSRATSPPRSRRAGARRWARRREPGPQARPRRSRRRPARARAGARHWAGARERAPGWTRRVPATPGRRTPVR